MNLDEVTQQRLSKVFPDVATRWIRVANDIWNLHKVQIRVTEGVRDMARQWELYSKGRKKEKNGTWTLVDKKLVVTNARPGTSFHQYGLAIDSCFLGSDPFLERIPRKEADALWKEYGRFVKIHGLQWGGDFNGNGIEDKEDFDRPHCQLAYGMKIHEILSIYEFGGIKGVWAKCNQIVQCGGQAL